MTPTIGRIVHYRLCHDDVTLINERRAAAGVVVRVGNSVQAGDVYPLVITRVWSGSVNGQVLLDGSDTLWVTSVTEGEGPRTWSWPPRV